MAAWPRTSARRLGRSIEIIFQEQPTNTAKYRRPSDTPYTAADVFIDVGIGYAAYPNTLKFGGNAGNPNSFVGLDVANLTGGVYNAADLFQGDNLACFSFSVLQQGIPDFVSVALNDLGPITDLINKVRALSHLLPCR